MGIIIITIIIGFIAARNILGTVLRGAVIMFKLSIICIIGIMIIGALMGSSAPGLIAEIILNILITGMEWVITAVEGTEAIA